jgi:hypothetical protein
LSGRVAAAPETASKAVGFKLFPEHWTTPERRALFTRMLADPRVRKVSPFLLLFLFLLALRLIVHLGLAQLQLRCIAFLSIDWLPLGCSGKLTVSPVPVDGQVILRRENRTQVYASSLKAERTGKWIGASLDQEQVRLCFLPCCRLCLAPLSLSLCGDASCVKSGVFILSFSD